MAQFGAIYACRESFVPFSPPRSQAGRILYRTRGRNRASQHNSTPGPTGLEDAGGSGGTGEPGRSAGGRRQELAELRDATSRPPHTNFAHNFPRSFFETTQKHCNSNDANSMFEQAAGELRAELMSGSRARIGKSRMQFDLTKFQQTQKTLQFQRCKFNV